MTPNYAHTRENDSGALEPVDTHTDKRGGKKMQQGSNVENCGGKKHDVGKLRVDLIPPEARFALAQVLTYGVEKYGDPSGWRDVPDAVKRYTAARDRHQLAIDLGETHDAESGLPHSWHALCNAAFLVALGDQGAPPITPAAEGTARA